MGTLKNRRLGRLAAVVVTGLVLVAQPAGAWDDGGETHMDGGGGGGGGGRTSGTQTTPTTLAPCKAPPSGSPTISVTRNVHEYDHDVFTDIWLQECDRLQIIAWGEIWAGWWFTGTNGPQGWNDIDNNPQLPLPGVRPYSVLSRIGSTYSYVGTGVDREYRGGFNPLYLRINDNTAGNGSGHFTVQVNVWRP